LATRIRREFEVFVSDQLENPTERNVGRSLPPRHGPGESFLRGPIAFNWISSACRLPGVGLHTSLMIRFLRGRFRCGRDRRWTLEAIARGLHVSDDSVRRGLRAAEASGLFVVVRRPGCRIIAADVSVSSLRGGSGECAPLRGPIPWSWLYPALRLPASAVRVGMACWHEAGRTQSAAIELAPDDWRHFGLSRFSAGRGLKALEAAGLVSTVRRVRVSPVVTLRDHNASGERIGA
jgi:hypothetical protein